MGSSGEAPARGWHWWETPFLTLVVYWLLRGDTPEQIAARLERWIRL